MTLAVEWSQGIEDAWADIASFVPKFIGFLAILLIGYFVAKAVAKAIDAVLERTSFDAMVERGGIGKAMEKTKYDPSDILAKLAFWGLFLIVLQMAFGVFGTNPVSDLIEGVIAYLPKVFAAILIIVIAGALGAAARELIDATLGGLSFGKALANIAAVAITAVGFFMALNQLQIAPAIVNGLFYAVLAVVVGSAVIAIGGSGIQPMRAYWERALTRIDAEAPNMKQATDGAAQRIAERAQQRKDQASTIAGQGQQVTATQATPAAQPGSTSSTF